MSHARARGYKAREICQISLRVTAVNQSAVSQNMAIFKVLCFVGFVLLSYGHAREHNDVKQRLFPPRHRLMHRHRHLLKRHLDLDDIPVRKSATKRSEKVEEWKEVDSRRKNSKRFGSNVVIAGPDRPHAQKEPSNRTPGISC